MIYLVFCDNYGDSDFGSAIAIEALPVNTLSRKNVLQALYNFGGETPLIPEEGVSLFRLNTIYDVFFDDYTEISSLSDLEAYDESPDDENLTYSGSIMFVDNLNDLESAAAELLDNKGTDDYIKSLSGYNFPPNEVVYIESEDYGNYNDYDDEDYDDE